MIRSWAVVGEGSLAPYAVYEDQDCAVARARQLAKKYGSTWYVAKLVDTHCITPPVCTCEVEVQDVG